MSSPTQQFYFGLQSYVSGYKWLKKNPIYLIACLCPIAISIITMVTSFGWVMGSMDSTLSLLWIPSPNNWWKSILYYIAGSLISLIAFYTALSIIPIITNLLSAPIYEWISSAIEKEKGVYTDGTSWLDTLLIIRDEAMKMMCMFIVTVLLLLIPGAALLTPVVTAFFLGWNAFDYPLVRRGWSLSKRWNLVRNHIFSITGLGIWLMIPILQIALMPMAIAGGTFLALDALGLPESERNIS